MQQKDIVRLDRILALLSSDHAGERASAAKAATALIKKHSLTWWDVLEGRALGTRAAAAVRRSDVGIDYLKAAESRIRQLQAHNQMLEKQVRRLKEKLEAPERKGGVSSERD
jgi:cell division protein FtsB